MIHVLSQVTVEDVVYVIDPGLTKGTTYSAHTNIAALETMQISRSNVQQRRGRAGRCRPGKLYKLYSEYEFLHEMRDHEAPEMLRTPVEELCLQARSLRLPGHLPVEEILQKAIDPPHQLAVENAVSLLTELGAFESKDEIMTSLGWQLSQMPLHPCLGKMLLLGSLFTKYLDDDESNGSLMDTLIAACSTLSFKSPFTLPFGKEKEADRARKLYGQGLLSDHLLFAKVLKEYNHMSSSGGRGEMYSWLDKNFLSKKTLEMTEKIKIDLQRNLRDLDMDSGESNTTGRRSGSKEPVSRPLISAILASSLSISFTSPTSKKVNSLHGGVACSVHPSSLLSMIESAGNDRTLWRSYKHLLQGHDNDEVVESFVLDHPDKIFVLCWFERLKTSDVYLRDCTILTDPLPLLLLLPGVHQRDNNSKGNLKSEEKHASPYAEDPTIFSVQGGVASQGGDGETNDSLLLKAKDETTAHLLFDLRTKLSIFFDAILSSQSKRKSNTNAEKDIQAVFNGLKSLIEESHSLYMTDVRRDITDVDVLEVRHLHNSADCEILNPNKDEGDDDDHDLDPHTWEPRRGGGKKSSDRESWRQGRGRKQGRGGSYRGRQGSSRDNNNRW